MSEPTETYWWPLWSHMHEAHGLTLLDDDCNQIAQAVNDCQAKSAPVAFILVNALRHLDQEQLVKLGADIASRCGHEMVARPDHFRDATEMVSPPNDELSGGDRGRGNESPETKL